MDNTVCVLWHSQGALQPADTVCLQLVATVKGPARKTPPAVKLFCKGGRHPRDREPSDHRNQARYRHGFLPSTQNALSVVKTTRGTGQRDTYPTNHGVSASHQPQDRQGPRPDHPAVAPAAGGSGDRVSDNGPSCPNCASDDVAIQGSSRVEHGHCPLQMWECRACRFIFAYRPSKPAR